jgi:hypothetical protein
VRIDKALHLIIPVDRDDGAQIFVHSTPIGSDVFTTYYQVIGRVFNEIYTGGFGVLAGPRIAALLLRDVAKSTNAWEGPAGVERGLVAEIRRLTNVVAPGAHGWEMVPFEEAVNKGVLDKTEASEVEGAITFFTVASCMHRRADRAILEGAMKIWSARIESLTCSEFISSLPTSTGAASSGVRAVA